jgi:hypothetical protein
MYYVILCLFYITLIILLKQRISEILDVMGDASANAQGLKGPITSGDKLRAQSEQVVYLLVDRESNAGRGSVVGFLKMGKKNLFLLDRKGEQVTTMIIVYLPVLQPK